ncbi:hypothetical protein B0J14DRAFT_578989 [Halenospora varia]|nr:hypothetical protein B0J14DRAFT_578989 [Halenospora varia]
MATQRWDPYTTFNIPRPDTTLLYCAGHCTSEARARSSCGWELDPYEINNLHLFLSLLQTKSPREASPYLRLLASLALCKKFEAGNRGRYGHGHGHQNQIDEVAARWERALVGVVDDDPRYNGELETIEEVYGRLEEMNKEKKELEEKLAEYSKTRNVEILGRASLKGELERSEEAKTLAHEQLSVFEERHEAMLNENARIREEYEQVVKEKTELEEMWRLAQAKKTAEAVQDQEEYENLDSEYIDEFHRECEEHEKTKEELGRLATTLGETQQKLDAANANCATTHQILVELREEWDVASAERIALQDSNSHLKGENARLEESLAHVREILVNQQRVVEDLTTNIQTLENELAAARVIRQSSGDFQQTNVIREIPAVRISSSDEASEKVGGKLRWKDRLSLRLRGIRFERY